MESTDLRFPVKWSRQIGKHALGSQRGALAPSGEVRKINPELVAFGQVVKYLGKATALVKDSYHISGRMR